MTEQPSITDSHCHLDFPDFEGQIDEIVARAAEAGVTRMVTIATKLANVPKCKPSPRRTIRSISPPRPTR